MSVKYSYNKKATFDTPDRLEDKIDKLTAMMGKLAARGNETNRQFKPQVYQSRRRGQSRKFYDIMTEEITKIDIDQIVVTDEISIDRI